MPTGMDVFEARIRRIQRGQQIIGEGVPAKTGRRRPHQVRRGGFGKVLLVGLLVAGSMTGAVAAGHGPEGLDDQLFALTTQVQSGMTGLLQTVADRGAAFGADLVPSG